MSLQESKTDCHYCDSDDDDNSDVVIIVIIVIIVVTHCPMCLSNCLGMTQQILRDNLKTLNFFFLALKSSGG